VSLKQSGDYVQLGLTEYSRRVVPDKEVVDLEGGSFYSNYTLRICTPSGPIVHMKADGIGQWMTLLNE